MDTATASFDASLTRAAICLPTGMARVTLPIQAGRIGASASAGACRVDLRDHLVFPGLVNAHEHLHINNVPPLKKGAPFPNSYAWIAAFQRHFENPAVVAALHVSKALRMRHGGLKNLLAGVTCVAHHDPWHDVLDTADFPVTLLREFGWSYTLAGPGYGPPVMESFAATPAGQPWMIHLAEGTDATACAELCQLDQMECLAANSVLVHGVGFGEHDIDRVIAVGAAVVWCPGSNLALLGRTLDPRRLFAAGCLALGSDSRISGSRDLLDELRGAQARGELPAADLLALATVHGARILRMAAHGHLGPGAAADMVIVEDRGGDPAHSLVGLERSHIRAVVHNGLPRIADPDFADWFAQAGIDTVAVTLDGRPKLLAADLADPALLAMEPGLEWFQARREETFSPALEAQLR
ncbi:amidohydrolase family protein [Dyella sp.]|uniref:amidohydrolase family protein n=1 Tax=Dyella sp. TaxID=1869338 RepID=UPI002ED352CB